MRADWAAGGGGGTTWRLLLSDAPRTGGKGVVEGAVFVFAGAGCDVPELGTGGCTPL